MTEPPKPPADIIPIGTPPRARPNPLLEELNFLKIEGRYFCFDRRGLHDRKGILEYRDGNRGLILELNDRFGHPGPLAYRIAQSVFRKITAEGVALPGTVSFGQRELGRWIGRDIFGGHDAKCIYRAIRQLEDTRISLVLYGKHDEIISNPLNFRFLIETAFIGEGEGIDSMRISATRLTVHPIIIDSMRRHRMVVFNWDRVGSLEPLTAALYKRLYLHFSNLYENQYDRATLRFEKDYAQMCGEWLGGLTVYKHKSRITQQLAPHLKTLVEHGLLRSACIERRADGKGFKLTFRPGNEFFVDYETFYRHTTATLLPFQSRVESLAIEKPLELAAYFYQRLKGGEPLDSRIFSVSDTNFLRDLETKFGDEAVRDLIDYAIGEAPKTNFVMQTVHALTTYVPAWQADKSKRATALRRRQTEEEQQAEQRERDTYAEITKAEAHRYLESLSAEARADLNARAIALAEVDHPKGTPAHGLSVTIARRQLIQAAIPLPTFEEWRQSRG